MRQSINGKLLDSEQSIINVNVEYILSSTLGIFERKKAKSSPRKLVYAENLENARYMFLKIELMLNLNLGNYS